MNIWCQKSIELATNENYLDRLQTIYSVQKNPKRPINKETKEKIEYAYLNKDKITLLEECFAADVAPIKDSYIGFLKQDKSAFERNPETIDRIFQEIYALGIDQIIQNMERPAESNRQMGQRFRNWVESGALGIKVSQSKDEFLSSSEDMVLGGSDKSLGLFARVNLGYGRQTGLDFLCRVNGIYVIGEAKFISASGGNQNNQFNSALSIFSSITTTTKFKVCPIAILDGVIYLMGKNKFTATLERTNENIMSALLLKDFLKGQ